MTVSEPSLSKPSKAVSWLLGAALVVSFAGFSDATYLTVKHYQGEAPTCGATGCELVTTSEYATVYGVPVALGGVGYYLATFLLLFAYLDTKSWKFLKYAMALVSLGLIATAWFVYLQFFVIGAICVYCMGSAISTTILFLLLMALLEFVEREKVYDDGD